MLIQGYKLVFNDIGHKYLAAFRTLKIKLKSGDSQYPRHETYFLDSLLSENQ